MIPETVINILKKYHINLGDDIIEKLLDKHRDTRDMFDGMINYEDLVRYLEERRLAAEKNVISSQKRKDNFILYETEHNKERHKRSKSWTPALEEKLIKTIRAETGSLSVSGVRERLVSRDDYGHGTVSAPVLRSVLRSSGLGSSKIVSQMMKASQVDNKTHYSIPVILDILENAANS